jgi:hypothetical protein
MDAHERRRDMLREVESLAAAQAGTPISVLRDLRLKRVAAEQFRPIPRRGLSSQRAAYGRTAITR